MELTGLSLIIAIIIGLSIIKFFKKRNNLPPGPWQLPILGYLPWLDEKQPYITLDKLSQKFGPIFGLQLGSIYTVVLTDPKLVKTVFNKDAASGRAPLSLTFGVSGGYGLISAQGEMWKNQRRFCYNSLRNLGATKRALNKENMEELIFTYALDFIEYIKSLGDTPVDPRQSLRHGIGCIMFSIIFGRTFTRDDPSWNKILDSTEKGASVLGVASVINFLPILKYLPTSKRLMKYLNEVIKSVRTIYKPIIDEETNSLNVDKPPKNILQDFLLQANKRASADEQIYNKEQLHFLLSDLFGAGLDTTLNTLLWYLLYTSQNKSVQLKIRQELEDVLEDSQPTLDDLVSLPYLQASVSEVLRIRNPLPLGVPHGTLDQIEILGYQIPKDSMIVSLQWSLLMSPKYWDEPEVFRPERFIDDQGRYFKPENFLPFQAGKRLCIGDELARMMLLIFAATIMKNFEINPVDGETVDFVGDCGITLTPKSHKLIFTNLINVQE